MENGIDYRSIVSQWSAEKQSEFYRRLPGEIAQTILEDVLDPQRAYEVGEMPGPARTLRQLGNMGL
jgi:hypothetical protein